MTSREQSDLRTKVIDHVHVCASKRYGADFVERLGVEVAARQIGDELLCQLRAEPIGAKRVQKVTEETTSVPLNWWEHVRQRWFPKWALRRRPVRMRVIPIRWRIEEHRSCPHLNTLFPPDWRHLEFVSFETTEPWAGQGGRKEGRQPGNEARVEP